MARLEEILSIPQRLRPDFRFELLNRNLSSIPISRGRLGCELCRSDWSSLMGSTSARTWGKHFKHLLNPSSQ